MKARYMYVDVRDSTDWMRRTMRHKSGSDATRCDVSQLMADGVARDLQGLSTIKGDEFPPVPEANTRRAELSCCDASTLYTYNSSTRSTIKTTHTQTTQQLDQHYLCVSEYRHSKY